MIPLKRLLVASLFIPLLASICLAKTVYVASNGNDSNNGTSASPFRTLGKAHSSMQAGDTCIVRSGTYRETLTITKNNLTFKAEAWHQATISANNPVNGWSWYQNNIYVANTTINLGLKHRQLYHNGALMDLARWPNNSDNDRFTINAHEINGGTASRIDANGLPGNLVGAYFWYLAGHAGTSWSRQITWQNANSIGFAGVNTNQWPYDPHNPTIFRNGTRGQLYVFNKLNLLDSGREWFYDEANSKLYFRAANGAIPANNSVEVTRRETCIDVRGDNVVIQGLRIFGGKVYLQGDNASVLGNLILHGKERLAVDEGASVGDASILVGGKNCVIKNNTIEHGSLNGIMIQGWSGRGVNTTIENNTIRYFNSQGIHASPIRANAAQATILTNTVSHAGRDVVYAVGSDSEIAYNDISHGLIINDDGGLFYTVGNANEKNIEIHHNWFHDTQSPAYAGQKGAGIYLDNNSKGFLVHHNVVWNVDWSGVQLNWENVNNNIYHNTIWNPGQAMGTWVNGYTQSNNRIWNNYSSKADWITEPGFNRQNNLINSQNQFVSIQARNFVPKWNSPLVNAGRTISGFEQNEIGAPDIGAYEYGGTRWTAGRNAIRDTGSLNLPVGAKVSLRAIGNLKYVSSENGTSAMNCNRNTVGGWEVFTIVDAGGGLIALKGSNGKYVSSNNGGTNTMACDRDNLGAWEKFLPVANGNGTVAFRGTGQVPGQPGTTQAYVSSENGLSPMRANRATNGWSELFLIDPQ
ncbi:MAG: right-handed parallel beta-helix repeat-containing protein [Verrucomicrobiota bacterium]